MNTQECICMEKSVDRCTCKCKRTHRHNVYNTDLIVTDAAQAATLITNSM